MTPTHEQMAGHTMIGGEADLTITEGYPPEDVLECRRRFIAANNWSPSCDEGDDDYDQHPRTFHLAKRDAEGTVLAAMRLTPLENPLEAMSLTMLSANPHLHDAAWAHVDAMSAGDRPLQFWDLTRLVIAPDYRPRKEALGAAMELFGAGLFSTSSEAPEAAPPVWLFATTDDLERYLRHTGIDITTVASGKAAPGDARNTHFCTVEPIAAMEVLATNNGAVYPAVASGFGAACLRQDVVQ